MLKPIIIDMNLAPDWASYLGGFGFSAHHWPQFGRPEDLDRAIMDWAVAHDSIIMTNDLDFGHLLALGKATAPNVIQFRTENLRVSKLGLRTVDLLRRHEDALNHGALITVDEIEERVRLLPI